MASLPCNLLTGLVGDIRGAMSAVSFPGSNMSVPQPSTGEWSASFERHPIAQPLRLDMGGTAAIVARSLDKALR